MTAILAARRLLLVIILVLKLTTQQKHDIDVYNRLVSCMNRSVYAYAVDWSKVRIPPQDADEHYADLLRKTAHLRQVPVHKAAGYAGPWIENLYIESFIDKPLETFSGMIPLFIQFVDLHVLSMNKTAKQIEEKALTELNTHLRSDVLYVAVSQDDEGLRALAKLRPNILTLSAGGFGHIPIPLIKGEISYIPPPSTFPIDIGFRGMLRQRLSRYSILEEVKISCRRLQLRCQKFGPSATSWLQDMSNTAVSLAPRGFGRTSYRLAEIIQMGRIPVYLYDDIPWVPYEGTNVSVEAFGFVGQRGHIIQGTSVSISSSLRAEEGQDLKRRLLHVHKIKQFYTYAGVLKQIETFFSDPLGPRGGLLRCPSKLPTTPH